MPLDVATTVRTTWWTTLGLPDGAEAPDFFLAGGTSLTAITLMERIERDLGIEFPLETLFLTGSLADVIEECDRRYANRS